MVLHVHPRSLVLVSASALWVACNDPLQVVDPTESSTGTTGTDGVTSNPPPPPTATVDDTGSGSDGGTTVGSSSDDGTTTDTGTDDSTTGPPPSPCGNGALDPGEECDEGGETALCDDDCTFVACGDDTTNLSAGEECDNGAANADDADCLPDCRLGRCGDGVLNTQGPLFIEACDDGNSTLADDCPDGPGGTCTVATCGDGFTNLLGPMQAIEECDDGNAVDGDACSNACTLPVTCGNSGDPDPQADLDGGEACDSGAAFNSDSTPGDCTTVCRTDCTCPTCGDGVTDYPMGEECDDANGADGDGCSANCTVEVGAACGNAILEGFNNENCDDGSQCTDGTDCTGNPMACAGIGDDSCAPRPGDGCSDSCQLEPVGTACGDSNDPDPAIDVGMGETCDEGLQLCADTATACTQDSDCPVMGVAPQLCLPGNGDLCDPTCRFENIADTFHPTGDGEISIVADNTWLWYTDGLTGELRRIDIQACIDHHANTASPCVDASGGAPGCADPCASELVLTVDSPTDPVANDLRPSSPTTDGGRLWFAAHGGPSCAPAIEAYIYELDIAACNAALAGGAADCNGLEQNVVGSGINHVDGIGAAAQLQSVRGLTYDNGFVYFLDGGCGTLRRFDPITAAVVTVVGDPTCGGGPAFQEGFGWIDPAAGGAGLLSPRYMGADHSGFLYISDNFDHSISRFNTVTSYLERFVGNPMGGGGYLDAHDGAQALFDRPRDITSDGTSLFVADFDNYTIRQVDIATGRVTTMAGVPSPGTSPNAKCDLLFGQGTAPGSGSQFTKPLGMTYHAPSGSIFFYTGGTGGAGCFGGPPCNAGQVQNQIWRLR